MSMKLICKPNQRCIIVGNGRKTRQEEMWAYGRIVVTDQIAEIASELYGRPIWRLQTALIGPTGKLYGGAFDDTLSPFPDPDDVIEYDFQNIPTVHIKEVVTNE
jgi:hypothetical protein